MRTHLDLFAGIGGFSLAARQCGLETTQVVEIEPFCQAVLRKNFPGVPIHADITDFDARSLRGRIDLLTGGFPCQDISAAGKGAGLEGKRSGLWFELLRVIEECRPETLIIENVPALRNRGADIVLRGLEEAGYSAEPYVVGADDIGASHRRKRVWIVAYAGCGSGATKRTSDAGNYASGEWRQGKCPPSGYGINVADADEAGRSQPGREFSGAEFLCSSQCGREVMADAEGKPERAGLCESEQGGERRGRLCNSSLPVFPPARNDYRGWSAVAEVDASLLPCVERPLRGVASRLPRRLDGITGSIRNHRLKALGNAIVPQVAYLFINAIQEALA